MIDVLLKVLNLQAASAKNKPDRVIRELALQPGESVADIGAGGGYYALRFAREVGHTGAVTAVDIEQEYLEFIAKSARKRGLRNLGTQLARGGGLELPDQSFNLIFLRNVFHDFRDPQRYFSKLKKSLKPGGRVAVIDFKYKPFTKEGMFGHYSDETRIVHVMKSCGFTHSRTFDFLPSQSFNIFLNDSQQKPGGTNDVY
ncbi:methyltransferase domain-containing protein [Paenibacillus sp. PK3_47]|uniref:class I SAM-dependent methyltransferase n=1 Tax=Paenibacillus sp. PK3_47 TaxID=2072642 RepID=UPI00201D4879|nr:methyltransferase domain-containing protein [Paenibacillus sp. PK3_47]